ncbi:MAG: type II 3-dehydroquinate dehydratase [Puniceicoccales bacterium]
MSSHPIGLLNGPNLGRLGIREPEVYGSETLSQIEDTFRGEAEKLGIVVDCYQSNHEGSLIDQIERWTDQNFYGVIINPGGLTHTSVALRDAIASTPMSFIEVHLSNVHQREEFRHRSLTAGVCQGVIAGLGPDGYYAALRYLVGQIRK